MAQNDPYIPDFLSIASSGSDNFDGSASSTDAAIISGVMGTADAELYIEASNDGGSSWSTVTQLTDTDGATTFTADWHTQYNRLMVKVNTRRLRIDNVDSSSGNFAVDGDER